MITIGIDLGGTRIKLGLIKKGKILASKFISTNPTSGLNKKLPVIVNEITSLLKENEINISECCGVAFAFPGIVDPYNKRILSTNEKYDDAVEIDLKSWCNNVFNLPFVLDNDANCALLGEWYYGAAKKNDNSILMILGTGIGTSVIINGELLRGKHFQAGCLGGHLTVEINGNRCTCGNYGCVEAEGGTWAIPQLIKSNKEYSNSAFADEEILDFKTIIELKNNGDKIAEKIFNRLIEVWNAGIVNMIHAYDPEVIVLSGGIMNSKEIVLPLLKEKIFQHAWLPWGKPEIVVAEDPDISVLLGLDYLTRKNIV